MPLNIFEVCLFNKWENITEKSIPYTYTLKLLEIELLFLNTYFAQCQSKCTIEKMFYTNMNCVTDYYVHKRGFGILET